MGKWHFSPGREEFVRAAQIRRMALGSPEGSRSRELGLKHADQVELRGREKFEAAFARLSKRDQKRVRGGS